MSETLILQSASLIILFLAFLDIVTFFIKRGPRNSVFALWFWYLGLASAVYWLAFIIEKFKLLQ
jgi:hypothetical protein